MNLTMDPENVEIKNAVYAIIAFMKPYNNLQNLHLDIKELCGTNQLL